jgi:H+-transporting ATPase
MIWCAIIVELALSIKYHHNWPDFAVLMGLQFINGGLSFYEANKAGDAVAALKKSLKPNAICKRDGKWNNMDAATLVPGDLVMLGAGAAVPADCVVNSGRIEVDQAALTGESLPVTMTAMSKPKMGSTVTRGEVEATVEFTGGNTFFGKTAAMIQSVEQMSHFTKVLLRIMAFLISISLVLCFTVLGFLMHTEKQDFPDAISFTVVLLVASIPMAMEVVTTTSTQRSGAQRY